MKKLLVKNIVYIKWIVLVLILITLAFNFMGPRDSKVDIDNVWSKMIKSVDLTEIPEKENQDVKRFLGLDPESYEGIRYCKAIDTMKADEIVLVKFKNDVDSQAFQDSIEGHKNERINLFAGYAPDEEQLLKNSILDIHANYAVFIANKDAQTIFSNFKKAIEG